MKRLILAALALAPLAAHAQAPTPPEMVLLPREVAQMAASWIAAPDPTVAVKLFATLNACINDNPRGGAITRMGPDQCSAVTDAIAARDKEIADLQKQIDAAKPKPPAVEPPK